MKKQLLLITLTVFTVITLKAQYVTIPDTAFRSFLKNNYPSCFNGIGQMDTTCSSILSAQGLFNFTNCKATNLDGIQYFKSLKTLQWNGGLLTSIPSLPNTLQDLQIASNNLISLPPLPNSITYLAVNSNSLTSLPTLPSGLFNLFCDHNLLTSLPTLPPVLWRLDCSKNQLTTLPIFPASFKDLTCDSNQITVLPALPAIMNNLRCKSNQLTTLPTLPSPLLWLFCDDNYLTSLPTLPNSLAYFTCSNNLLTTLPQLPPTLDYMVCSQNAGLTTLPALPQTVRFIECNYCGLTSLPSLPSGSLTSIAASDNPGLTFLPALPSSLEQLDFRDCGLNSLPTLPPSLKYLYILHNNIHCLPKLPVGLTFMLFDSDKIPCIPNSASGLTLFGTTGNLGSNYPICNATNNVNACEAFPNIQGNVFYDMNSNGIKDAVEYNKVHGKMSLSNGAFTLTNDSGNYQLASDTLGSFTVSTIAPSFFNAIPASTTFNFSTYDTIVIQNIALQPTSIHDSLKIQLTSFRRSRPGFPQQYLVSYENAGSTDFGVTDISLHFNNLLLTYDSSSNAAVTNAVSTLTLQLPSLHVGEIGKFISYFTLSTSAFLGSTLVTDVTIISGSTVSNDTLRSIISNSFDPNDKDATPSLTPEQVINGKFIDYIIRFQNTGTDTAFHVVVADTLSTKLQTNTFEVVSTSHNCQTIVKGNVVTFKMRNILLPDSNINESGSHGFLRFRIKPTNSLIAGDTITNKAAIYFDYNNPVFTNTAITQIASQVLPLKLISFKGKRTANDGINLYWYTNNEMNTKSFEIEQSTNTREFLKVAEVTAIGYGNNNYTRNITDLETGNLYFRLKMLDKDGTFSYSTVILIKDISKAGFILQENPVQNEIVLSSITPSLLHTEGVVVNNIGAIVKRFTIHSFTQTIAVNDLPSGIFYLKTIQGSEKVIISR